MYEVSWKAENYKGCTIMNTPLADGCNILSILQSVDVKDPPDMKLMVCFMPYLCFIVSNQMQ